MTTEQIKAIIDKLPESRRKRALVEVARDGLKENKFWQAADQGLWAACSEALLSVGLTVYADAVWEG